MLLFNLAIAIPLALSAMANPPAAPDAGAKTESCSAEDEPPLQRIAKPFSITFSNRAGGFRGLRMISPTGHPIDKGGLQPGENWKPSPGAPG